MLTDTMKVNTELQWEYMQVGQIRIGKQVERQMDVSELQLLALKRSVMQSLNMGPWDG